MYGRQSAGGYGSSPSSAGGGGNVYGYGASPPSGGGGGLNNNQYGGGGGYYGGQRPSPPSSGCIVANNNNYGTPSAAGYPNASAGYGGAYNNSPTAAAVASPYANAGSSGYPNTTAPPAYNNAAAAGYGGVGGGGQRAINFDSYGGGGSYSGSPTANKNPFQHKKSSSSSFNLGSITSNILPLLLGLTICTLTATTFHFRSSMLRIHAEIESTKQSIDDYHQRTSQKFASDREKHSSEKTQVLEANTRITSQIDQLKSKYEEMSTRHKGLLETLNEREKEKQSLLKKIDHTKYALEDATFEADKYKSMVDGKGEVEAYMKKRERALWDVVERLETKIGRESWREAEEW